jgi:hypothetical protein
MKCTDCQESFVDYQEGLLEPGERLDLENHLVRCAQCADHYSAMGRMHQSLADHSHLAAGVSVVNRVMTQVRKSHAEPEQKRSPALSWSGNRFFRWAIGGAAVVVMAAFTALFITTPTSQATAAEIMTRGINAARQLTTIHMQFRVRTLPADNFGQIEPGADFVRVEIWKEFGPPLRWRVEKPGRVALMDGNSTLLYLRSGNVAEKFPQPSQAAFDTGWLHQIANIESALESELRLAQSKGWKMNLTQKSDASGARKAVVTIEAKSGLPDGDYLQNKSFDTADTRRVFVFDDRTGKLESVQIYMAAADGEQLIVEVERIAYNEPLAGAVFQMELPANVFWIDDSKPLTDERSYAQMTAQQAARAFFQACADSNWTEVAKFWPLPLDDRFKSFLGGIELVSLGEPFTSKGSSATFVPYEIRVGGAVRKHNLALKKDRGTWVFDGGL